MEHSATPPIFWVNKLVGHPLSLDGQGASPQWEQSDLLHHFTCPWNDGPPPFTHFKALWDDAYFYFLFQAHDPHISKKATSSRPVVDSDRVEIFFKTDDEMNPYYSLEMDALGRVLSTENRFYRKIDMDWKWPGGHFDLYSSIHKNGYKVEGRISLDSLRQLNLLQGNILKVGLFRGEYFYGENGVEEIIWISWVKPDSEVPDFHIASAFGVLELVR